MGKEIVHQESFREPGKRSRLWNHEDVFHVLKNETGTNAVRGLFLDMSKIPDLHLRSEAFEKMSSLKFLKFYKSHLHDGEFIKSSKVHLPLGLRYLSDELSCNVLQSIPELPPALMYLDASYCRRLQSIPELPSNVEEMAENQNWKQYPYASTHVHA
ncbi:disease resistance protein RPP2B-like [Pistacia vera]|uniref:disease resistance protein RPP2B-like n=1 Tax=Pistacia vera TaxID=55513 RepID=UPI001263C08D|nr:disease resistance protein RPP2B-like [Pistacia vera]